MVDNHLFGRLARERSDLLYEVVGPALAGPSFLFGTVHLACNPPWLRQVVAYMDRVQWFAGELDLLALEPVAPWTGTACREVMGPRWVRVALAATLAGLPVAEVAALPPMAAWFALLAAVAVDSPANTVDGRLFLAALVEGVETRGLETLSEVRDALCTLSQDVQIEALLGSEDSVVARSQRVAGRDALRDAYVRGCVHEIVRETHRWGGPPELHRVLLGDRNARFVDRFVGMATVAPGLAAVGAAHLYGPEGMVERLRASGHRVAAIPLGR